MDITTSSQAQCGAKAQIRFSHSVMFGFICVLLRLLFFLFLGRWPLLTTYEDNICSDRLKKKKIWKWLRVISILGHNNFEHDQTKQGQCFYLNRGRYSYHTWPMFMFIQGTIL